jgi:hypothetical protein
MMVTFLMKSMLALNNLLEPESIYVPILFARNYALGDAFG